MGFLSWLSLDRRKREEEEMDQSVSDAMSSESEVSSGFEEDVSSSFESSGDGVSSSREGSSSDSDSDSRMQNGNQVRGSRSTRISNRGKVELRRKGHVNESSARKRTRITKGSKKKTAIQTRRKAVAQSHGWRKETVDHHHDVHGESQDDGDLLEMKKAARRVKSLWKVRPLPVDEKIKVFIAGRDDGCNEYDGGDFHDWCKDCEAGRADAMEAGAYPLVIQDADLRPILEIKYPSAAALKTLSGKGEDSKKRKPEEGLLGIKVPSWKLLPQKIWPENCLSKERIPIVRRTTGGEAESAVAEVSSNEEKQTGKFGGQQIMFLGNLTEPEQSYIRYMQPTPDDLDQAIEYDMDDEDEVWLAKYNKQAKARSRTQLGEEWLEHLMDRMEKEYTAELQKHPEKWTLKTQDDRESEITSSGSETMTYMDKKFVKGIAGAAPPPLVLPSISELFPLKKCLQVSGLDHDVNVIKDVYKYWKEKHERAGRPLIQRLWYEPPWHRKFKASEPTDANIETDDVFSGYDMPSTLSKIRKRKLDEIEVQNRFDLIRRDLEMARTLADQVRRREKLKKQEALLLKEEWACRMRGQSNVAQGDIISVTRGKLQSRPPKVLALKKASTPPPVKMDTNKNKKETYDRASRLAARRNLRAEAAAATRTDISSSHRRQGTQNKSLSVKGPAPPTGIKRDAKCWWCKATNGLLLGCSMCHRCFCFKCFQKRPGLGVNIWSHSVKDPDFQCVVCQGIEEDMEAFKDARRTRKRLSIAKKRKRNGGQPRSASGRFLSYK